MKKEKELDEKEVKIAGYYMFYLDENVVNQMIIPFKAYETFIEKFGSDFKEYTKDEIVEMKKYLGSFSTVIQLC